MLIASSPQQHQRLVLDRLLDPVGRCLTRRSAQALLNLQADSDLQAYIEDLARKSTAGKLTAEERSEYEALVAAGTVISILKSKARVLLAKSSTTRAAHACREDFITFLDHSPATPPLPGDE